MTDIQRDCVRSFDPWKGNLYGSLFGIRLLILGEAHYDKPEQMRASYTIDTVRKLGQEGRFRFFTVTMKLVLELDAGGWVSTEARRAFWEQVAFCNFIQTFPGDGPRIGPDENMWSAGREPLLQTIRELDPQMVLVLGKRLRDRLPELPARVHVCPLVRHPSGRGFRLKVYQPVVRAAIVAAGGKIPTDAKLG